MADRPATSQRVPGHVLISEGAVIVTKDGRRGWTRTPDGHGLCSCGAMSPLLNSNNARKRWHREHKAEVLADG